MVASDSTPPPDSDRRRQRSSDTLTALGLQLEAVLRDCEVAALVVTDFDGTPVASAGDMEEVAALATFASSAVREVPHARSLTTTRGFVHVDVVQARGRLVAVAAYARFGVPSPEGVARAVQGATRILRQGLSVRPPPPESAADAPRTDGG